jgi:hypothetical protein
MLKNKFAYCTQTMTPLVTHPKMQVVADILHIQQASNYSIVCLDSPRSFSKHTATELYTLYCNLGGCAASFRPATLYLHHEAIRKSCIELAIAWPTVQVNEAEAEVQAVWVDRLAGDRSGYEYWAGSLVPKKMAD